MHFHVPSQKCSRSTALGSSFLTVPYVRRRPSLSVGSAPRASKSSSAWTAWTGPLDGIRLPVSRRDEICVHARATVGLAVVGVGTRDVELLVECLPLLSKLAIHRDRLLAH